MFFGTVHWPMLVRPEYLRAGLLLVVDTWVSALRELGMPCSKADRRPCLTLV